MGQLRRTYELFRDDPANQLPLALWLESDRMRSLAVTQENLDNQREAVKEEKRLRYDNQPYGQIFDLMSGMIYKNFANAHSTIGSMEDLDEATVEDVREFFGSTTLRIMRFWFSPAHSNRARRKRWSGPTSAIFRRKRCRRNST